MSQPHLLGIGQDSHGRITPVFATGERALDSLGHHRAVVEALRQGPFVPAAYSNAHANDQSKIMVRLRHSEERLRHELARSQHAVEIGLAITFDNRAEPDETAPLTGRSFLRTAASRQRIADAAREAVNTLLQRAVEMPAAAEFRILAQSDTGVRVAFAVSRHAAPGFVDWLERQSIPGSMFDISGPWPLYSFGLRDILARESVT